MLTCRNGAFSLLACSLLMTMGGLLGVTPAGAKKGGAGVPPSSQAAGRKVDCSALLAAGDVQKACGGTTAKVAALSGDDHIGPDRTCSRQFSIGSNMVSFMVTDERPQLSLPPAAKNVKKLSGVGSEAVAYEKASIAGGDGLQVQFVKKAYNVLLFQNPPLQGQPPCSVEQLIALAKQMAARL